MKRVVIIGGTGFLGSYVTRVFAREGYEITVFDNNSRGKNPVPLGVSHYGIDITDTSMHKFILAESAGADLMINLAADVGGVHYNHDNGDAIYESNIKLQTIPVELAKEAGVTSFIQVSSVCAYGYDANVLHNEDEHVVDTEPFPSNYGYSMAKRYGEEAAQAANFEQLIIARPANMAGARDYFDAKAHVIPALIKRAYQASKKDDTLTVYSPPDVIRQFIHPYDVATAFLQLYQGGHQGIFNIASPHVQPVGMNWLGDWIGARVYEKVGRWSDVPQVQYEFDDSRPYEMSRKIDERKLVHTLSLGKWPTRRYTIGDMIDDEIDYYHKLFMEGFADE